MNGVTLIVERGTTINVGLSAVLVLIHLGYGMVHRVGKIRRRVPTQRAVGVARQNVRDRVSFNKDFFDCSRNRAPLF